MQFLSAGIMAKKITDLTVLRTGSLNLCQFCLTFGITNKLNNNNHGKDQFIMYFCCPVHEKS